MKKSLISFVVSILCLALLSSPTYALGDSINTNSVDVAAMVEEAYNAKYGFDNGVQPMQLDEVRIQKENAANDVYYRVLKILEANIELATLLLVLAVLLLPLETSTSLVTKTAKI